MVKGSDLLLFPREATGVDGDTTKNAPKSPHKHGQVKVSVIECKRQADTDRSERKDTDHCLYQHPVSVSKQRPGSGKAPPDRPDEGASRKCCVSASVDKVSGHAEPLLPNTAHTKPAGVKYLLLLHQLCRYPVPETQGQVLTDEHKVNSAICAGAWDMKLGWGRELSGRPVQEVSLSLSLQQTAKQRKH